jgi:hypothetical protein
VQHVYDSGSNDANNTRFVMATLDGTNIAGGMYRVIAHFFP